MSDGTARLSDSNACLLAAQSEVSLSLSLSLSLFVCVFMFVRLCVCVCTKVPLLYRVIGVHAGMHARAV